MVQGGGFRVQGPGSRPAAPGGPAQWCIGRSRQHYYTNARVSTSTRNASALLHETSALLHGTSAFASALLHETSALPHDCVDSHSQPASCARWPCAMIHRAFVSKPFFIRNSDANALFQSVPVVICKKHQRILVVIYKKEKIPGVE